MVPACHLNHRIAMKALFLLIILAPFTVADVPRKAPITRYTGLWTNSPFTSKPPPAEAAATVNPLEDYTLTGISPVPGGYRITIMSRKNQELKKVIEPGITSEFSVVAVNRVPGSPLGTTVVLSSGSIQGTVSFEKEMLTLKAAPAPQNPQPGNMPPGITPAQANQQPAADPNAAQRQPRPRIVPPPAPAANPPQGNNQPQQQQQRGDRRNR